MAYDQTNKQFIGIDSMTSELPLLSFRVTQTKFFCIYYYRVMWDRIEMVKVFFVEMKCSTNYSHSPGKSMQYSNQWKIACLNMVTYEHKSVVLLAEDKSVPLPCISSCQLSDHVPQHAKESDKSISPFLLQKSLDYSVLKHSIYM